MKLSIKLSILFVLCLSICATQTQARYLGRLSDNPYEVDSIANPYGRYGSPYSADSINNPFGEFRNEYGIHSVRSRYANGDNSPKLYDDEGNFRGNLNNNPYDPDSIANPHGRYGSPHSADSINNPYGAGRKFDLDSPRNEYGRGWEIRYE